MTKIGIMKRMAALCMAVGMGMMIPSGASLMNQPGAAQTGMEAEISAKKEPVLKSQLTDASAANSGGETTVALTEDEARRFRRFLSGVFDYQIASGKNDRYTSEDMASDDKFMIMINFFEACPDDGVHLQKMSDAAGETIRPISREDYCDITEQVLGPCTEEDKAYIREFGVELMAESLKNSQYDAANYLNLRAGEYGDSGMYPVIEKVVVTDTGLRVDGHVQIDPWMINKYPTSEPFSARFVKNEKSDMFYGYQFQEAKVGK
jgi:hypothetical protein